MAGRRFALSPAIPCPNRAPCAPSVPPGVPQRGRQPAQSPPSTQGGRASDRALVLLHRRPQGVGSERLVHPSGRSVVHATDMQHRVLTLRVVVRSFDVAELGARDVEDLRQGHLRGRRRQRCEEGQRQGCRVGLGGVGLESLGFLVALLLRRDEADVRRKRQRHSTPATSTTTDRVDHMARPWPAATGVYPGP
jgi:hypothetical protein